jgi:hypothetical protein
MFKVFMLSKLREHDSCQLKPANEAAHRGKKAAQSAKTAPPHMKTLT